MKQETFFEKNQVLISGILSAVAIVLQQFLGKEVIDYKALGLALLLAVAGYLGNALRGRGITILGIIGIAGYAFYSLQTTGTFTWSQLIISVILGVLSVVAPPAKPITYEKNVVIVAAKEVPPQNQVPDNSKLPDPLSPNKV